MSEASERPTPTTGSAPPGHEFVDHPSEAHILVRGRTLAEVAAEAGLALAGLALGEPLPRAMGPWREVDVRSRDRIALLVDWLNELIYLGESERWIPLEFDVLEATTTHIRARMRGVERPESPSLVKAATYHGATLENAGGGLEAHLLLDV
ncbi:MAG: archease [Gemmatimonadales bacterium]|nr:archease [Gemmatimonadales bacterium]